jgi:hypothetical protein
MCILTSNKRCLKMYSIFIVILFIIRMWGGCECRSKEQEKISQLHLHTLLTHKWCCLFYLENEIFLLDNLLRPLFWLDAHRLLFDLINHHLFVEFDHLATNPFSVSLIPFCHLLKGIELSSLELYVSEKFSLLYRISKNRVLCIPFCKNSHPAFFKNMFIVFFYCRRIAKATLYRPGILPIVGMWEIKSERILWSAMVSPVEEKIH